MKLVKIISFFSSWCLRFINVKVKIDLNKIPLHENFLVVSNHLSYLDIIIINKYIPSCFVTSLEIKDTPFLGWICSFGGCLFINRINHHDISEEIRKLAEVLKTGLNVTFFPEATSTNGSELLKFKIPFFQSAILSERSVLPLCINYLTVNGEEIKVNNRDYIFWYGSMSFFKHIIKLFSCHSIEVELKVLDKINLSDHNSRQFLAEKSYLIIKKNFIPIVHE